MTEPSPSPSPVLPEVEKARERDRLARERLAAMGDDPVPIESTMSWAEQARRHEFSSRRRRPA